MHVDTGHNFPEVLAFRDRRVDELGLQLIVATVQDAIDRGTVREEPNGSRNRIQTPVLLEAAEKYRFDALFGGARRDEEKARAKERVFSFRDEFGQWDPKNQRPELWSLYNGRVHQGESIRVFPLSNWTELDVWQYIAHEQIELPSIYFAHEREVFERDGMLFAVTEFSQPRDGDEVFTATGALPHGRRRHPDRRGLLRRRHASRRSSTRSPSPGSPSAAPPAATTRSARPPWKTASGRATSDGPAAVRHRRLRRRRQEHAHRAAALRHQGDLRGPARVGRAHQPRARRRVHQPRAAHRRAARRARAGHHDRRGLPLLRDAQAQVHHRRHPGAHPVHPQHGHRRVDGRPGAHPGRRPQGAGRAEPPARVPHDAAAGAAPGAVRQQDGPGRLLRGRSSRRSAPSSRRSRPSWTSPT